MKMMVSDTGLAAQMQVIKGGHDRATMGWLASTGEFTFSLADDKGVTVSTFEIKPDGKAYIGGKEVAVVGASSGGGLTNPVADQLELKLVDKNRDTADIVYLDDGVGADFVIGHSTNATYDESKDSLSASVRLGEAVASISGVEVELHSDDGSTTLTAQDKTAGHSSMFNMTLTPKASTATLTLASAPYMATTNACIVTKKFFDDNTIQSKADATKKETKVSNIVSIKQADYDALATKEADKLYIIVG